MRHSAFILSLLLSTSAGAWPPNPATPLRDRLHSLCPQRAKQLAPRSPAMVGALRDLDSVVAGRVSFPDLMAYCERAEIRDRELIQLLEQLQTRITGDTPAANYLRAQVDARLTLINQRTSEFYVWVNRLLETRSPGENVALLSDSGLLVYGRVIGLRTEGGAPKIGFLRPNGTEVWIDPVKLPTPAQMIPGDRVTFRTSRGRMTGIFLRQTAEGKLEFMPDGWETSLLFTRDEIQFETLRDARAPAAANRVVPRVPHPPGVLAPTRYTRSPGFPESAVFVRNSRRAAELFDGWLDGRAEHSNLSFRQVMERMHVLYMGDNDLGKGNGGKYLAGTAPVHQTARSSRDYVRDRLGLRPVREGEVDLPGIPAAFRPSIDYTESTYLYPPGKPEAVTAYYGALETHFTRFAERANQLAEMRKIPFLVGSERYKQLEQEALDAIVDFGRVGAAFRQFGEGNWGLYGPMIQTMVGRLGYHMEHPGYLDIAFQTATPESLKPWFAKQIREGKPFYTADGYNPLTNTRVTPPAPPARP